GGGRARPARAPRPPRKDPAGGARPPAGRGRRTGSGGRAPRWGAWGPREPPAAAARGPRLRRSSLLSLVERGGRGDQPRRGPLRSGLAEQLERLEAAERLQALLRFRRQVAQEALRPRRRLLESGLPPALPPPPRFPLP